MNPVLRAPAHQKTFKNLPHPPLGATRPERTSVCVEILRVHPARIVVGTAERRVAKDGDNFLVAGRPRITN
jgi:hypothetical protein